jgi:hypothetical protein
MRDYASTMEFFNALTAVVWCSDTTGGTCTGYSIDTAGFQDVLMVVSAANVSGTNASHGDLIVSLQESATKNGTDFSEIKDGAVNGTCKVTLPLIGHTVATNYAFMGKAYEKLGSTSVGGTYRKRYIRAFATLVGTAASGLFGAPISVGILLGRPTSTLYIQNPASFSTGNPDCLGGTPAWSVNSYIP